MEIKRNAYEVYVGKPKGKRTLAKARYRWQDIRICLPERGGGAWIGLIWLRIGTNGRHL
jgi:hypothetical protein